MTSVALQLLASALSEDSGLMPKSRFDAWFRQRALQHRFVMEPIPFDQLEHWGFHRQTGRLCHQNGKSFSVGGLRVHQEAPGQQQWDQPVLHQPIQRPTDLQQRLREVPYG